MRYELNVPAFRQCGRASCGEDISEKHTHCTPRVHHAMVRALQRIAICHLDSISGRRRRLPTWVGIFQASRMNARLWTTPRTRHDAPDESLGLERFYVLIHRRNDPIDRFGPTVFERPFAQQPKHRMQIFSCGDVLARVRTVFLAAASSRFKRSCRRLSMMLCAFGLCASSLLPFVERPNGHVRMMIVFSPF